jgi:hypothetical protein
MSVPTGRVTARGRSAQGFANPGHYLAFAPSRKRLFVLRSDGSIARLSAMTLRSLLTSPPPTVVADDSRFVARGIQVGQRTGDVYRFGNVVLPKLISAPGEAPVNAQRVVVDVMDAAALRQKAMWEWGSDSYDWRVYRGALSPDESRVYVSYHGMSTTGADTFDTHGNRVSCAEKSRPNEGCLEVHGNVEPLGRGVIGASGEGPLRRFDGVGHLVREYVIGLPHNHLMEFALSPDLRRAYAIGSCLYSGGLSIIDIARARTHVARAAGLHGPTAICGERIAVGKRYALVIAANRLLVLDAKNGRLVRRIALAATPVDVLVQ